jgi:propionyl-CoA carboxylase alpha chain
MKMQHEITTPSAGTVSQLGVAVGDQVDVGAVLAIVDQVAEAPTAETQADGQE